MDVSKEERVVLSVGTSMGLEFIIEVMILQSLHQWPGHLDIESSKDGGGITQEPDRLLELCLWNEDLHFFVLEEVVSHGEDVMRGTDIRLAGQSKLGS